MPITLSELRLCPNFLLAKLSDEYLQTLLPRLEKVHTNAKDVIYERNQPIPYVYFPCTSGISSLIFMADGAAVEVGTVGNEGFTGVELLVGATLATESSVCQIAGNNIRMKTSDFQNATVGQTPLRHVTECYFQGYLSQVSQSVACNRIHAIEARFARWLLITHDRVQGHEFHLTQEFLANMLGVQRPSVSIVAGGFQKAGLIEYSRGNMKILNRDGLETAACECYGAVRAQFKRLFGVAYG